ncbi:hypothetical protein FBEOM_9240 [Fusarium beomiforme]|uniref:LysM domain-containing protein n=1 Tax=Fusarium beomiforme TaxID=44412 RepID=A0A9P5AEQ2_9HYPO|nr:hypothetical protein FBEOM_9240 [Fusarium beomiforme]
MKASFFLAVLPLSKYATALHSQGWQPRSAESPSCELYSVQEGDSCFSITKKTNATFAQIIAWNTKIDKQCANLSEFVNKEICVSNPEGNYTIPGNSRGSVEIVTTTAPIPEPTPDRTSGRCAEYHLVVAGENCGDFTLQYEITLKDFIFLNPHVWENCTNVYKDYYYCVRPVGYISTYPGYLPSTSTKEFIKTPTTPMPIDFGPPDDSVDTSIVIPMANQTREDCYHYLVLSNLTDTPLAANCWLLAMAYDITPEELVLWNPSLADNSTTNSGTKSYNYPCTLSARSSYCVALESATSVPVQQDDDDPPSPRAAGEIKNCTAWFAASPGYTCENVLLTAEIALDDFYRMNPSVNKDCSGMSIGTYYCVSTNEDGSPPGIDDEDDDEISSTTTTATSKTTSTGIATPTPIQDGMVANCNKFHQVKSTTTCEGIANYDKIELSDFYKWNPKVNEACTNLNLGAWVCVGLLTSSTTTSKATTTSSGNGITTPTAIQAGMVSNCNKFHLVKSTTTCQGIVDYDKITMADFLKWNTGIKSSCSNLELGTYACVGVIGGTSSSSTQTTTKTTGGVSTPTPTQTGMVNGCTKFHYVQSTTTCQGILDYDKITLKQLYKWNPAVKSDCSGLWAKTWVCVAGP